MPVVYDHDHENEIIPFAATNFRNEQKRFGIKTDDRRRHTHIMGKTGMGKTTLLENLVMADIAAGHGVGVVDPHGDFAEKLLDLIPSNRVNDVVYFNPADMDWPIGFNVLEAVDERHKHLVASGMMGVFKKIWPDVWSPRMEYILNNCMLALLDYPDSTMLGINRLLVDREYRKRVISKIRDPVVKSFWVDEYASYAERFRTEAIAPIQNKVGQFLSTAIVRNIVAQVKSTINPRTIMDEGKIFIMNLSKGRMGEEASRLLGGMLITKLQLAAMERVDVPENERRDFYLYVDEFQNFATESFANILSEARKYHLNLIVAHQYIEQLDEKVAAAVFGNVGTIILFRVGGADAELLEKEFFPTFLATDFVNLAKYDVYLKLMIDGVASSPFSAITLPPVGVFSGNREKVIRVSRERYGEKRQVIEEKVLRWTGMAEDGEEDGEGENGTLRSSPKGGSVFGGQPPMFKKFDEAPRQKRFEGAAPPSRPREFYPPERKSAPPFSPPPGRELKEKEPARGAPEWIRRHESPRPTPPPVRQPGPVGARRAASPRPAPPAPKFGEVRVLPTGDKPVSLKELAEKSRAEERKKEIKEEKAKPLKTSDSLVNRGSVKPGETIKLDK